MIYPAMYHNIWDSLLQYSRGRQIFSNKHNKYLQAVNGYVCWYVSDNINDVSTGNIRSGCSPSMCPAHPRSRYSKRDNQTSWHYTHRDGELREANNITIHCDSLHHGNEVAKLWSSSDYLPSYQEITDTIRLADHDFISEDVIKNKATGIQNLWKSVEYKLRKENIKTTQAFVKAGYLSKEIIDTKVSQLKSQW